MASLSQIYDWFMTGKKPTQTQFWASWGSFWNKEESIPQSAISNLTTVLNAKAEKSQFDAHQNDGAAHQAQFQLKEDKANKGEANGYVPLNEFVKITAIFLNIVNDLETGGTTALASAETVKALKVEINGIKELLTSDDVNLDTVQEIVDAIKTVETSLETILVNDLTTGGVTKALTAEMGKSLKALIDALGVAKFDTANVSNDIEADKASTSKVPSVKQVYNSLGVSSLAIIWVSTNGNDSTAELGNKRKPCLTIDAALDFLPSTGGVIYVGVGTFNSPTKSKIKSNVSFFGSGKPFTNSVTTITGVSSRPIRTSPTKLVGGTILSGTFDFSLKDNISIKDLGVDVGSEWCTAYNGGLGKDGIITYQTYNLSGGLPSEDGIHELQTNSRPTFNITVDNVIVLAQRFDLPGHALQLENVENSRITNSSTYYAQHGIVIKGINVDVQNIDCHSHQVDGFNIKSNDYAYCENINVSNVYINSLNGYEGYGLRVLSENGTIVRGINISNLTTEHVTYGLMNYQGKTEEMNVSNIKIFDTQFDSVVLGDNIAKMNINNLIIDTFGNLGLAINSSSNQKKSVSNVSVSNGGGSNIVLTTSGSGVININNSTSVDIVLSGSNIFAENIQGVVTGSFFNNGSVDSDEIAQIGSDGLVKKSQKKLNDFLTRLPYDGSGNMNSYKEGGNYWGSFSVNIPSTSGYYHLSVITSDDSHWVFQRVTLAGVYNESDAGFVWSRILRNNETWDDWKQLNN